MGNSLVAAYVNLKEDIALNIVKSEVAKGASPSDLLEDCHKGMLTILDRYEKREYPLTSVLEAMKIFQKISCALEPSLPKNSRKYIGRVVIGSAQGEIHCMGRDLVASLLESLGFEVSNLGADVPPDKFVQELKRTRASILCISALVTNSIPVMKQIVNLVHQAGLKPKILIGGPIVNDLLKNFVGADDQTQDMVAGARICLSYAKGGFYA